MAGGNRRGLDSGTDLRPSGVGMTDTGSGPPIALNIDAEQALLGAVLVNNDAYFAVSEFLLPSHFAEPIHGEIYRVMATAIGGGRKATTTTLLGSWPAGQTIGDLTGSQYVARLASCATTVFNAGDYGRVIFELALERQLRADAEAIIAKTGRAYSGDGIVQLVAEAEDRLAAIRNAIRSREAESTDMSAAVQRLIENAEAVKEGRIVVPSTGYHDLDHRLGGGCLPGRLIVVAGRPGMGKTAMLCDMARRVAVNRRRLADNTEANYGVAIFTLEVDAAEITARIVASAMARGDFPIDYRDIMTGSMTDAERLRFEAGSKTVADIAVEIDQAAGLTIDEIEARARIIAGKFRNRGVTLAATVIDYIGLVQPSERYRGRRVDELGQIALGAKNMSKRLGSTVFLASQLSRAVEGRDDKRPQLSDLRDSGNIEEHADAVCMLYRPAYYLEKSPEVVGGDVEALEELRRKKFDLEIIVPKNRLGPTGTVKMYCDVARSSVDAKLLGDYE